MAFEANCRAIPVPFHACRRVPFNSMRWSRVRDHFGDQNARSMFDSPLPASQAPAIAIPLQSVQSLSPAPVGQWSLLEFAGRTMCAIACTAASLRR